MAVILKPSQPPRLGLVGIDRFGLVTAAAGMGDMIDAAAQRPAVPGVDQVKCQRRMDRYRRMQPACRLPGLETDGPDRFAGTAGFRHRQPPSVAGDDMAAFDKAGSLDLQPLHRAVDIAHGSAGRLLFTKHMPGLQRLTHFERDAAMMDAPESGESEFELSLVPIRRNIVAGLPQFAKNPHTISPAEM